MKLSKHVQELERIFSELMTEIERINSQHDVQFQYRSRRPNHILPRERTHPRPPKLPTLYEPETEMNPVTSKEKLVLLVAFEAMFHDAKTPLTPDMVPLIIDTGASISISPNKSDFISPVKPVQKVHIKGIASGLQVEGNGNLSYTFYNDDGEEQTILLKGCLYVP
jgi:hypothetical protein